MGKLYKKHKTSRIVFCLDGLHEELSLYRINASYDKIIENALSFMEGGGKAEWRMIIFKHKMTYFFPKSDMFVNFQHDFVHLLPPSALI